ncbi:glutamate--tRNA ligase [Lichenibacterium dinghuense]|uniref:glutamate--tRNA ligase n=1 Tax=Lichenibacterium dinghuense TaxID=2895977 RepID=UPI001F3A6C16|nr:glutamate--tRNA ligase [Lichenibacterium sp. 6Y81]
MASPVVRFAPSPTGRIHIGNARPALLNALFARAAGGRFVLRFDDTDVERSRAEYAESIEADLHWLGVRPDLVVRQSDRFALYAAAADRLRGQGRLYPAYETADELDRRRKRLQARGLPPVYDRAALKLTPEQVAAFEAEGRRRHWRFRLDHRTVAWDDLVRGPCTVDCASLSDPVLVRADGSYLYTLPSVVDDADLGITHVIRGEDHVTNAAVQIQIFEALGAAVPAFAHHNLLTTAAGEGLSKRSGALAIGALRDEGVEALAVAAMAVLTGSSAAVRPVASLDALAEGFDLRHLSRAPARFDEAELRALSAKVLHGLPFDAVASRLALFGIVGAKAEPFWAAVRGNLSRFAEVAEWWSVVEDVVEPAVEDEAFLDRAAALLPPEPWGADTWGAWTAALKAETGRKGRALFHPLRLALTARDAGPDLKGLLPLIGRARASDRIRGTPA